MTASPRVGKVAIVAAAVVAATSSRGGLGEIVIAMVVTLFVYWVAERYSAPLATGCADASQSEGSRLAGSSRQGDDANGASRAA